MSDLADTAKGFGAKILVETLAALKGEYAAIPASVKEVMPRAAVLLAEAQLAQIGGQEHNSQDLKHAMAIIGNVKVGGQIALSELMLSTAANILAVGIGLIRKVIGI